MWLIVPLGLHDLLGALLSTQQLFDQYVDVLRNFAQQDG